jgi:hypothetical protein
MLKILFSLFIVVGLISCELPVHEEYDLYGDYSDGGAGEGAE